MNLTECHMADRVCVRTTKACMSDRQTASAAICVKQESMPLFHPVSTAVAKPSLYNQDDCIVSIYKKGQDSIGSSQSHNK